MSQPDFEWFNRNINSKAMKCVLFRNEWVCACVCVYECIMHGNLEIYLWPQWMGNEWDINFHYPDNMHGNWVILFCVDWRTVIAIEITTYTDIFPQTHTRTDRGRDTRTYLRIKIDYDSFHFSFWLQQVKKFCYLLRWLFAFRLHARSLALFFSPPFSFCGANTNVNDNKHFIVHPPSQNYCAVSISCCVVLRFQSSRTIVCCVCVFDERKERFDSYVHINWALE